MTESPGLSTMLAVQKWPPEPLSENTAPTRAAPTVGRAVRWTPGVPNGLAERIRGPDHGPLAAADGRDGWCVPQPAARAPSNTASTAIVTPRRRTSTLPAYDRPAEPNG